MSLYTVIFIQISLLGLIDYLAMKVGEIEDMASELNNVVSNEQVLLQECAALLHQAHGMQVWFRQKQTNTLVYINLVLFYQNPMCGETLKFSYMLR